MVVNWALKQKIVLVLGEVGLVGYTLEDFSIVN